MKRTTLVMVMILVLISGCSTLNPGSGTAGDAPGGLALPTPTGLIGDVGVIVTEIPAPTAVPTVSINPNDECGNPFYPVVTGAQWTYINTIASDGSTSTAIHTMETGEDNYFSISIQGNDSTAVLNGQCTDDGIILMDVPGISGSFSSDGGGSTMTTQNVDGVTLPNDVQVGDDWSQTIQMTASANTDGGLSLSATLETSYTALGYEQVTTPSGTFYALKVEQNGSMSMGSGAPFLTHGFIWYAQDIGIVKSGLDGTYNSELSLYVLP